MPVLKFTNTIIPVAPQDPEQVPFWLRTFLVELKIFLDRVASAISLFVDGDIEIVKLTEQTVEPHTPVDGMIVYADGTTWNPGAGEGFYGRQAGAWVKL